MTRKRRTEILIKGSEDLALRLAGEILQKYDVRTIQDPNNVLVMVKMRETARRSLFYAGEMFITECKVQINHNLGIGMVYGHEPELAYYLAVIDCAYNAGLLETNAWTAILLSEENRILAHEREHNQKVLNTRVKFETMDV